MWAFKLPTCPAWLCSLQQQQQQQQHEPSINNNIHFDGSARDQQPENLHPQLLVSLFAMFVLLILSCSRYSLPRGLRYFSDHRQSRIKEIAQHLSEHDYDVVFLQEVGLQMCKALLCSNHLFVPPRCGFNRTLSLFDQKRKQSTNLLTCSTMPAFLEQVVSATFVMHFQPMTNNFVVVPRFGNPGQVGASYDSFPSLHHQWDSVSALPRRLVLHQR